MYKTIFCQVEILKIILLAINNYWNKDKMNNRLR